MKRIRVVGLCLVAMFAMSAIVASAASAAAPEFQICAKSKSKTGKYKNKTCSEAEPGGKGGYEREEWSKAKKKTFKGKNVGTPKNQSLSPSEKEPGKWESAGAVECKKEAVVGSVTGPKELKWKTVYSTCTGDGGECQTPGAKKKGEIDTEELEGTLVYLDKAKTKVGLKVKGVGTNKPVLASYECAELVKVLAIGEVIVEREGNTETTNKKTKTIAAHGAGVGQKYASEEEKETEAEGFEYFDFGFCVKTKVKEGDSEGAASSPVRPSSARRSPLRPSSSAN